jgi:two-component system sensor histidine kinase ChvG
VKSNRAVLRLFGVSLATLILVALVLLGFAAVLSERIRRLRNSAEQAVGPDGSVRQTLSPASAPDELGDLGRSVSLLLDRLHEHQTYLRTLADKLAHELRTPLAVIRSSLDNLEHAREPEDIARYCQRANEGSARLNRIFQAMSQAGRIEESIESETRKPFDLAALLQNYVEARRETCPERRITLRVSARPGARISGSADLFAQLLDKLIDNAVDFSPERGRIDLRLTERNGRLVLDIENEGPGLPEGASDSLFDSMVSRRKGKTEHVHLGLGLYIARLITEYHHGTIRAASTSRGVRVQVELPGVE